MAAKEKTNPGNNGYDPERVKQAIKACEDLQTEIATIKSEMMLKCKDKHSEIKDIIDDAKASHGIPKRALRQVLKIHALELKAQRARDDQEPETQDAIDLLRAANEDFAETELGQAAQ